MRIICLFLLLGFAGRAQAQPSKEDIVNAFFAKIDVGSLSSHYLIAGSDTCRFEKFDYDEWVKYHLKESVPLTTLNELAYKVHLAREPYYWQQDKLKKVICINAVTADSLIGARSGARVFSISQPQFTDDGEYVVVDINWKWDIIRGAGYTFLFRRAAGGWLEIGFKQNWGGDQ